MAGDFLEGRPTMKDNNSLKRVFDLLVLEVAEVAEVLDNPKIVGGEISDVIIFCLTLANLHEVDLEKEVRTKLAFNNCRYTADLFQDGDYTESRKLVKKNEVQTKRDFYGLDT